MYLVAIGSDGSVSVSRHTYCGVKQICGHRVGPGMVSPITVVVVSDDGCGGGADEVRAG